MKPVTGNVVVPEVHAVVYMVLKQGRKTRVLWGISKYQRMRDVINEVSH